MTSASRYTELFAVGRGGMGRVVVALEQGDLGFRRIVAQKRLLPEIGRDARHKAMFLREAKLAALLCHPNVVRAFDAGEADDELYLTMEYVAGQTLASTLDRLAVTGQLLPLATALFVVSELCEGLHAAHELCDVDGTELAVVHRDVSPHNVMLGYDGSVKLLDFGVAKIEAESSATRTGEIKGKVRYMSPEQAMGDGIDRRSDLYAIGAVLYECATGARMWGNGTDMEVMRKLALGRPPRLLDALKSRPDLEEGSNTREVIVALDAIHAELVHAERDQRPANAADVARALRALLASGDLTGSKESARDVLRRLFADEERAAAEALAVALEATRTGAAPKELVPAAVAATSAPALPAGEARSGRGRWVALAAAGLIFVGAVVTRKTSVSGTPRASSDATSSPSSGLASATAQPRVAATPSAVPTNAPSTASSNATLATPGTPAGATSSRSVSAPSNHPAPKGSSRAATTSTVSPPMPTTRLEPLKPPPEVDEHPF